MVRPIKNNADWFSHQNNMRNDKKIKALRTKYGNEGYAIYCMLLETLAEADCIILKLNDIEFEMLSGDFNIESSLLKNIINYCVKIDLFQKRKDFLLCKQLDQRLKKIFDKRKDSISSLRSKKHSLGNKNKVNSPETIVKGTQSTQSKVKKRKEKKKTVFSFDSFWNLYDKKTTKKQALEKWKTISEKDRKAIKEFIPQYIKYKPDKTYRKDPIRFLRDRVWEDNINDYRPKDFHEPPTSTKYILEDE